MHDAAHRFTEAGHEVLLVDQYDGDVFNAYDDALDFATLIGYPELMKPALGATEALADGFGVAGFSNGAGMAEFIATRRRVGGVLLFSGALPLIALHEDTWPAGVTDASLSQEYDEAAAELFWERVLAFCAKA